jgi:hypothetical protein
MSNIGYAGCHFHFYIGEEATDKGPRLFPYTKKVNNDS